MKRISRTRLAAATALSAILALNAAPTMASSHREAPAITKSPKVDGTDFYMFRSYEPGRDAFVTMIANYQPLQSSTYGPNYFTMDPDAIYEIHIDLHATSNYFGPGHRIRVDVSSSNFPRWDRNLNTGGRNFDERNWTIAGNAVHHGSRYPSRIVLPVVPGAAATR